MSKIVISALGPSIKEQCGRLGLVPTGMSLDEIDRISRFLTTAHIYNVLTDAEINRARVRLLKQAKFVKEPA